MARRRASRAYRLTPNRRVALKKAQLASARKRKGHRNRNIALGVGAGIGLAVAGGVTYHKLSGSTLSIASKKNQSIVTGKRLPNGIRTSGSRSVGGNAIRNVNIVLGSKKLSIEWQHKAKRVTQGSHLGPRSVDRDSIPLYKASVKRSYPHVGPTIARQQNKKLREKGMLR